MSLMKDGLWGIVTGTECAPGPGASAEELEQIIKFNARKDKALAIIVLSYDPSLLYIIGNPVGPKVVWEKLRDQFQKKDVGQQIGSKKKTIDS